MIDRELPVMAVLALAVGLLLTVGINSFAETDGSEGEELRPAADRPASDVAALRIDPAQERRAAAARTRRKRRARRARRARAQSRAARRAAASAPAPATTPGSIPQQGLPAGSPQPAQSTQPQPAQAPRPQSKPKPSGGGPAHPFDDSG